MKVLAKRLKESVECTGMVQDTKILDTQSVEHKVARMCLDDMTKLYPDALLLEVRVSIEARLLVDDDNFGKPPVEPKAEVKPAKIEISISPDTSPDEVAKLVTGGILPPLKPRPMPSKKEVEG